MPIGNNSVWHANRTTKVEKLLPNSDNKYFNTIYTLHFVCLGLLKYFKNISINLFKNIRILSLKNIRLLL